MQLVFTAGCLTFILGAVGRGPVGFARFDINPGRTVALSVVTFFGLNWLLGNVEAFLGDWLGIPDLADGIFAHTPTVTAVAE